MLGKRELGITNRKRDHQISGQFPHEGRFRHARVQIKMRGGPLGKSLRGSCDLTAVSTWTGLLQVVL